MPRMRTIKPEAATSESLNEVDRGVRWTFAALWTHCDDEGRAVRNLRLIKAALYPLDDAVTVDVLADDLNRLEAVGALCFYEVAGKQYLHVPSWSEHQHPNRKMESKLPPCNRNQHCGTPHPPRSEDAVSDHAPLTPVVVVGGERLGEGDGETGRVSAARELVPVADAPTAQTIVAAWIDWLPKRPPQQIIGQIAKHTRQMLAEGIDPADVRYGLAAWSEKGLHPSTLPSVVNEVMNAPKTGRSRQQDETDAMFERAARRLGVVQ